jgi:tRNA(Ile2) C34 agmatinyltransferase TiaS
MIVHKNSCYVCDNEHDCTHYTKNYRCNDCTYKIATTQSYQGLQNTIYQNK